MATNQGLKRGHDELINKAHDMNEVRHDPVKKANGGFKKYAPKKGKEHDPKKHHPEHDPSKSADTITREITGGDQGYPLPYPPKKVLVLIDALLGLFNNGTQSHEADEGPEPGLGQYSTTHKTENQASGNVSNWGNSLLNRLAVLLGLQYALDGRCINANGEYHQVGGGEESCQSPKKHKVTGQYSTPDSKSTGIASADHSPFSGVSFQGSSSTTDSKPVRPSTGGLSSHNPHDSAIYQDSFVIHRHSIEYPAVRSALDSLRENLEPILSVKLKKATTEEVTVESGLETAASVDLLKFFNPSNLELVDIAKTARRGAMMMEEGEKQLSNGKKILESALREIPKHI